MTEPAVPPPEQPASPPAATGEAPPAQQTAIETVPGMTLLTGPRGDVYNVKDEDVQKELASGARPATDAEYFKASAGGAAPLIAGAASLAQGASFDYGIPAALGAAKAIGGEQFGEGLRRGFAAAREAEPGVWTGGELVGSLVPALLGAPEGTAATGESLLARAFQRAAAAAPRAAFEGSLFGVGHQLTEDALGNHETTAQKLLASAEGGAVFGAILGSGFAAGGSAVSDLARGLLGRTATHAMEGEAYRAAAKAGGEEGGGALSWLRGTAEEQAFKGTGAKTAEIRKLGATGEEQAAEVKRLGRRIIDEGLQGPFSSKTDQAARVEQKLEEAGKALDAMRKPLDAAASRPVMGNILQRAEDEIFKPLTGRTLPELQAGMAPNAGSLFGDREAQPAADALERLVQRAGNSPSFEQLHSLRLDLDEALRKTYQRGPGPLPPGEEGLLTLRRIVEDEYTRAADVASKEVGGEFAQKYALQKGLYSDLKKIQGILAKEVPREVSNRTISLSDTIAGAEGLGIAANAIMGGHPLGVLASAAPLVNKAIRTYGNQAAAYVLDKASQLQAVQRATAKIDSAIRTGARDFIKGSASGKTAAKASEAANPKATAETAQRIREAVRSPEAFRAHVEDVIASAGLRDNAPNISQALASAVVRAATYVASKAPPEPPRQGLTFKPQPPRPVSAVDAQRFQDIVDTVNDPMSVIHDLQKGRLNRDKIDALKNVYPQLHAQLCAEIAREATAMKPELSDQQEIALSVLTGQPINAMMRPENIRGFDEAFAQGADQASEHPTAPKGPSRPLMKGSASFATGLDKLEAPNART